MNKSKELARVAAYKVGEIAAYADILAGCVDAYALDCTCPRCAWTDGERYEYLSQLGICCDSDTLAQFERGYVHELSVRSCR